jgi:hypothetical protein
MGQLGISVNIQPVFEQFGHHDYAEAPRVNS